MFSSSKLFINLFALLDIKHKQFNFFLVSCSLDFYFIFIFNFSKYSFYKPNDNKRGLK